ncbi:MAG: cytochrome c oxidase subunit II [Solirubrobacterales bacterium]
MRPRKNSGSTARALAALALSAVSALALSLVFASVAGADAISPEAGPTQNAQDTDALFKIMLAMAAIVVAIVWAILFYSLFRFRGGRDREAAQIRGNSALELGWTIAPVVIVIAIIAIVLVMLPDIKNPAASGPDEVAQARGQLASVGQPPPPGGNALEIDVSGQQFIWRFEYPNGAVSFHDMVVPKDETVVLKISTTDVAHSWWIPKLGGKFDALPGLDNETWFKATETGSFSGQCAELCGANHAFMTARVQVVEPDQYRQWLEQLKSDIDQARTEQQRQSKQFAKEDV